jgi:hypothetical protein
MFVGDKIPVEKPSDVVVRRYEFRLRIASRAAKSDREPRLYLD